MALAHELTSPNGGASPSLSLAEARLHLHREQYHKALACLDTAIQMDLQVCCNVNSPKSISPAKE